MLLFNPATLVSVHVTDGETDPEGESDWYWSATETPDSDTTAHTLFLKANPHIVHSLSLHDRCLQ